MNRKEFQEQGIPTFNDCEHVLVDLSDVGEEGMKTIVMKLPNGDHITFCLIAGAHCADICYHGDLPCDMLVFNGGAPAERVQGKLYCLKWK